MLAMMSLYRIVDEYRVVAEMKNYFNACRLSPDVTIENGYDEREEWKKKKIV